jgi:hypothetical protein
MNPTQQQRALEILDELSGLVGQGHDRQIKLEAALKRIEELEPQQRDATHEEMRRIAREARQP